ncbi:MAG: hypothetical protein IPO09_10115 [Anaeromyxobacter sp.]|nr:hypothetical protein [Anaeromyxobacter sp.]MBL0278533.1 hypothetical protein [Anaeromyxobacter sp.]
MWSFTVTRWFTFIASMVAAAGAALLAVLLVTAVLTGGIDAASRVGVYLVAGGAVLASAFSIRVARRAWRAAPPGPAAARLHQAIATNRRAREWGLQPDDLLGLAFSRDEEAFVMLGAFAVAVDGGDNTLAASLIERGLNDQVSRDGWAGRELWLQGAMFAALVQGDRGLARLRLSKAEQQGAAKMEDYASLAKAAVALAEGQLDAARGFQAAWLELAKNPKVAAHIAVGNHWALDLLHARLHGDPA